MPQSFQNGAYCLGAALERT